MEKPPESIQVREVANLLRLARIQAGPVVIQASSPELLEEVDRAARELANQYAGRAPGDIAALAPARELYRSFGIDPTHTRPSSEALLRRVLQQKPLPRILNAVDLCNHLSLKFLLPLGLYDVDRITGPVVLRRGRPGETFPGIRKEAVSLEGRPVLEDSRGPFGNPTSDSLRTSITESTRRLWLVIFAPISMSRESLESSAGIAREALCRHLSPSDGSLRSVADLFP
jgi:DNA/RNA-binding domain of Phe-tRNA-synthetase-like protein